MYDAEKLHWNSRVQGKMSEYGWRSVCGFFFFLYFGGEVCVVYTVQLFRDPPKPSGWYRKYIEKEQ